MIDPQEQTTAQEDAEFDAFMQRHFGLEAPSAGLGASATSELAASEEAKLDEYVRQHFRRQSA